MTNEQQDESLGIEQLPQTELDTSPGKAEEQSSKTEDADKANIFKAGVTTTDAAKQMAEQNPKNDD